MAYDPSWQDQFEKVAAAAYWLTCEKALHTVVTHVTNETPQ